MVVYPSPSKRHFGFRVISKEISRYVALERGRGICTVFMYVMEPMHLEEAVECRLGILRALE